MGTPTDAVADRVSGHVAAFNDPVAKGEHERLAERFVEDAVMSFVGVPVGPFVGRPAIRAAYPEMPPDDTMEITSVHSDSEIDTVRFLSSRWNRRWSFLVADGRRCVRAMMATAPRPVRPPPSTHWPPSSSPGYR